MFRCFLDTCSCQVQVHTADIKPCHTASRSRAIQPRSSSRRILERGRAPHCKNHKCGAQQRLQRHLRHPHASFDASVTPARPQTRTVHALLCSDIASCGPRNVASFHGRGVLVVKWKQLPQSSSQFALRYSCCCCYWSSNDCPVDVTLRPMQVRGPREMADRAAG